MANSKRNYRIFIFKTILLISGSILPAQDPGPPKWWDENLANDVDARSRRIASAMIIGVAHQDIKTMAIPFLNTQDIGIGISVEEAVAQQASEAVLSIAIQGTTGISASLIAKEIATYVFGATAGTIAYQATPYIAYVYALYEILKADHVQFRTYSFYAPIIGNYNITCDMPGDIDYPRNRVRLYTGTTAVLDWEERWSSSRKKTFKINLTPGFYTLSVGLGSGTSVSFHNSGTLYSLYFSENSAVRWDAPVVLSQTSYRLLDSLPSIGSRTALRTTWNGSYVNPYMIDGQVVSISDVTVLSPLVINPKIGTTNKRNKFPERITDLNIGEYLPPTFDGSLATYFVERTYDSVIYRKASGDSLPQ